MTSSLELYLYYGDVKGQRGDLKGAMESFQRAAELDPTCPLPYLNAARAYLTVRDYPETERHLQRVSERGGLVRVVPVCCMARGWGAGARSARYLQPNLPWAPP